MTIWIFAILLIAAVAVTGWRQGAIRASISFGGIVLGVLFCGLVGKLFALILPVFSVKDPLTLWLISPICGFILINILAKVAAFNVFTKVDIFYRYKAGNLRLAMWERLDSRLGICVGVLNGAAYFILVSFVILNLSYWTAQAASDNKQPSMLTRVVNQMGHDLESTGIARAAAGVWSVQPDYYNYADLTGLLMQNPQLGARFATYPGLTGLWQRDEMQSMVNDSALTNTLASSDTLGDVWGNNNFEDFIKNKDLRKSVLDTFSANYDDLTNYLQTGVSAKYGNDKVLGHWQINMEVTLAWLRQAQPNLQPKEVAAVRAFWQKAYSQVTLLATGDGEAFVMNLPEFKGKPGDAPTMVNWKGTWTADSGNYTLDLKNNDQEKFLSATAQGNRLIVKDGHTQLIFDKTD